VPSTREGEAASSEGMPGVPNDEHPENLVPLISVISPGKVLPEVSARDTAAARYVLVPELLISFSDSVHCPVNAGG